MQYAVKTILLCAMLMLVVGCATSIQVRAPSEGCSSLIAGRWAKDVPSAVLGDSGDAALDWQLFGIEQTGQLKISNRDKSDALETIRRCEGRDAQIVGRINRPWWRFWS